MSGLGCDRTHGRSGSAQIETNKFQSTLPEGSDRRHQQICGASLRRRVERPHHDTSQVVHLLKIPDFLFVSILKLRPMGMTTPTSHTGWSSTMTVPWSESDHWGTSAGRSPSISFRCRLVSPVHQGLWRTSSATTSRTCSAATPKGTPSVRRRRSKRVANCIDAYSMASRTVPPPPYAPSSRRRRNGRPPNDLWGTRHGNHR